MPALDLLSNIVNELGDLQDEDVVYEGAFTSFTPFMPGDFKTRSWEVEVNISRYSDAVKVSMFPTKPHLAPSLVGRLRWALRALLANYVQNPQTFGDVERAFKINNMSLIDFVFGRIGERSWGALYKVVVKYEPEPVPWALGLCCAYLNALGKSVRKRFKELSYLKNRYCSLLSRSGSKDPKLKLDTALSKLPIARTKIEVKVIRDSRFSLLGESQLNILRNFEEKLLKNLIEFTLFSLGLGKATSRGFGRFVSEGEKADSNTFVEIIRELNKNLEEFVEEHYGYKKVKSSPRVPIIDLENGYEILDVEIKKSFQGCNDILSNFKLNVKPSTINKMDKLIEIIGEAVTKNIWKKMARIDIKEPGPGFHTWPLGLPRLQSQQKTGYLLSSLSDEEGVSSKPLRGDEGRRQSMIYLFPTADSKIIMIKMFAYDMFELIDGSYGKKMFHQGKHSNKYHYASIRHIMTKKCLDKIPDLAGVIAPKNNQCEQEYQKPLKELYEDALKAAEEWIKVYLENEPRNCSNILNECGGRKGSKGYGGPRRYHKGGWRGHRRF